MPEAQAIIDAELDAGETLFATVLSKVEILGWMRPGEERTTRRLFDGLRWVEVTGGIAEDAALYARTYGRSHRSIDPLDYVIAATRDDLDVPLWTLNVKHFPMFRGPRPPY
ncbi:MAG TPA: type II toxin-antitoxin system VapC family toxin [Actinomycetota bacterium]